MRPTAITIIAILLSAVIYGYAAQPHSNLPTIQYGETPDIINLIKQGDKNHILFNISDNSIVDTIICNVSILCYTTDNKHFKYNGNALFTKHSQPKQIEVIGFNIDKQLYGIASRRPDSVFYEYCNDVTRQIVSWCNTMNKKEISGISYYDSDNQAYPIQFMFYIVPTPANITRNNGLLHNTSTTKDTIRAQRNLQYGETPDIIKLMKQNDISHTLFNISDNRISDTVICNVDVTCKTIGNNHLEYFGEIFFKKKSSLGNIEYFEFDTLNQISNHFSQRSDRIFNEYCHEMIRSIISWCKAVDQKSISEIQYYNRLSQTYTLQFIFYILPEQHHKRITLCDPRI